MVMGQIWRSSRLPSTTAAFLLPSSLSSTGGASPLSRRSRRRGRRPGGGGRLVCSAAAAAAASSYNGWGELSDVSSFSFFLLDDEDEKDKKKNGRRLLLLLVVVIPASAVALSRILPPLPLLTAAFTAGFAARHLSSPPPPSAPLTVVLADLDAQVRALRDSLLTSSSHESQGPVILDAVDRLRDAVLHATRLAHHDTTPPLPLGDLAFFDSMAAWARDAIRDLTPMLHSKQPPAPKDLRHSNKVPSPSSSPLIQDDDAPGEDMLPFSPHNDDDDDTFSSSYRHPELDRLLLKHRRRQSSTSSLLHKRTLEIRDRSYRLNIDTHLEHSHVSEDQLDAGLDPSLGYENHDAADSHEFIKEAAQIFNKARDCMMTDEETADSLLYKSARLLSTAVALKPTSLVAVGQLGNTYLLHGELKLKISRELRTLLANTGALSNPRSRKNTRMLSRESVSAALVDVCEECESLLVEAGRSYRTALSIDSGDVKALYNWGLALIYRAQLLADIGPEAAVDADRVYLAAIDKFDAMLSKSNTYAPEALYRWGTALQQRSHLRPRNNREKIRLLEQAKTLFEDVLYVEADNKMVREALSSCISELNYHGRWI